MKICFVRLNIYPALSQRYGVEEIGGAELQQIYIGKGLRDRGYQVWFITRDHCQIDGEIIDGMSVYKTFRKEAGIPVIRFVYPRLAKIWQTLYRADADIYYVRCAGFLVGIVAFFCNLTKKKFVFAGASDTDFIPEKLIVPTFRDKLLYKYGLKRAAKIIVQSKRQKQLLKKNFSLNGIIIKNFSKEKPKKITGCDKEFILWVSTIKALKRPYFFLSLAEHFSKEKFVMIGGRDDRNPKLFEKIKKLSKQIQNLDFLGFQPLKETEKYFDRAKVFINTSTHEGFPNTFLQAWRRGTPVISFVDPDNIVKKNNLGFVVENVDDLRDRVNEFLKKPPQNSASILKYFTENHSSAVIDQYCEIIKEIMA